MTWQPRGCTEQDVPPTQFLEDVGASRKKPSGVPNHDVTWWERLMCGHESFPPRHFIHAGAFVSAHSDPTSALVLVFCGPHELTAPRGVRAPVYNRIDAGIELARNRDVPLVILGDAFEGEDVREFTERATMKGIDPDRVYQGYRNPSNTRLEVARVFSWLLRVHTFPALRTLYFVTDPWHLPRVLTYAHGEAQRHLSRHSFDLVGHAAHGGLPLTPQQLAYEIDRETRGIADYLLGNPHTPRGEPLGKPEHVHADLAAEALAAIERAIPIS